MASHKMAKVASEDPADVLFGVPKPKTVKRTISILLDDSSTVGQLKEIKEILMDGGDEGNGEDTRGPKKDVLSAKGTEGETQ